MDRGLKPTQWIGSLCDTDFTAVKVMMQESQEEEELDWPPFHTILLKSCKAKLDQSALLHDILVSIKTWCVGTVTEPVDTAVSISQTWQTAAGS